MTPSDFLQLCLQIGFVMVMASLVIGFYRLAKGPTMADRVVAIDMMNIIIIVFCTLFGILVGNSAFLDVAIVLALIGFLSTVALARYAERRFERDRQGYTREGNVDD